MTKVKRVPRLYRIWHGMKQRCYNPNAKGYQWYGGKGIAVCNEWRSCFFTFQSWALDNGYADNLTIDRINSSKGYCPDNCRWLTLSENVARAGRGRIEKRREELIRNYPVKFYRSVVGVTRKRLSEVTGICIDEIKAIDDGEIKPEELTAKNLLAIADALGVDPHILLEG